MYNRYGLLLPAMIVALLLVGSAVIPRVYAPTVIVFDGAASTSCSTGLCGTTLSWSHTVGSGSSRILVVGVTLNDPSAAVSSVSYGASSLVLIASPNNQMAMYYLLNPPIGTLTVTVTFTVIPQYLAAGGSVSYFNVYGVGPSSSNGGAGAVASVSVASTDGELVVDLLGAGLSAAPIAAGSGQALRWAEPTLGAMSDKAASSPTTPMTYTLAGGYDGGWNMIAVVLLPGTKAPVGGVVMPTNKLDMVAPFAALAGLIVAVSAVVMVKRRKD